MGVRFPERPVRGFEEAAPAVGRSVQHPSLSCFLRCCPGRDERSPAFGSIRTSFSQRSWCQQSRSIRKCVSRRHSRLLQSDRAGPRCIVLQSNPPTSSLHQHRIEVELPGSGETTLAFGQKPRRNRCFDRRSRIHGGWIPCRNDRSRFDRRYSTLGLRRKPAQDHRGSRQSGSRTTQASL